MAVVKNSAGRFASAAAKATVGAEPAGEEPGAVRRDWLVVHYQRENPDDYDGWGLHVWGDGFGDGVPTEWATPRPPDGTDSYGAFWNLPLKNASAPVNFIGLQAGDECGPRQGMARRQAGHPGARSADPERQAGRRCCSM
jgi:hypothetical protein